MYQESQIMGYASHSSPEPVYMETARYASPGYTALMRNTSTPPTSVHSRDGSSPARAARPKRSTPTRPRKRAAAEAPKVPELVGPLSVLTKDMKDVPLKDMEAWVNRPAEVRQKEVEKRNGHIARPMNSFMLYRSAYADRTKLWCLQNNHQVVSSVSGKSWPMESSEVRKMYNELAKVERDNHQSAHPEYKFSPSKNGPGANKKRKSPSDDEDEPFLTPSDGDSDYRPSGGGPKRRPRHTERTSTPEPGYGGYTGYGGYATYQGLPGPAPYHVQGVDPYMNGAHFSLANSGRPMPAMVEYQDPRLYYHLAATHGHLDPEVDADFVHPMHPVVAPKETQSVVGLPGYGHGGLLGEPRELSSTPLSFDDQLDPMIMGYAPHGHVQAASAFTEQGFRDFDQDDLGHLSASIAYQALPPPPPPQSAGLDAAAHWSALQTQLGAADVSQEFEGIIESAAK